MKKKIQSAIKQIICLIGSAIVIIPFLMVFLNSFKTKGEAARMKLSLPQKWMFENYVVVIEKGKLVQGFSNSLLYAGVSTAVAVIACAMAAYVMSRNRTKLNNTLFYFMLCGLFFPSNFLALIKVLTFFGINNTRLGLIIAFTSAMIPFCIFTLRNFIISVPVELDEAGVIDGAGPINLFFKIILPLLKPVLVTVFILQFMGVWSDFMTPLYLSNASEMWPMNLAVYNFFGKFQSSWNLVFADIILTILPVIIVYLIGQKHIIGGMTQGAVKE